MKDIALNFLIVNDIHWQNNIRPNKYQQSTNDFEPIVKQVKKTFFNANSKLQQIDFMAIVHYSTFQSFPLPHAFVPTLQMDF